ncbi:hypothetical protein RHSIM_Rhsim12G0152400 [Rhododendron simsii]|uniref:NET domain-containing protein n=1 Tax=Rhododendron simsii TaxID=118357 RepID=A0A834L8U9_RHOSS|nr:hypothetical protein RHSIM_Rhsim12G0152400 [Rhododendron simsii]
MEQKIVIIPVEALLGKNVCECGQQPVFLNKQCVRNTLPNESKKSEANKSKKAVNVSTDDRTLYAVDNPKVKPSAMGCRKRGLPGLGNVSGKEKRRKLDLIVPEQRSRILKQGCNVNGIKKPEVNKLQKGVNVSAGDHEKLFAVDNPKAKSSVEGRHKRGLPGVGYGPEEKRRKSVRDAMEQCSSVLKKLMSTAPSGRKCLEAKWNRGCKKMDEGRLSSQSAKNTCKLGENGHEASPLRLGFLPECLMSADEKQKLRKQLLEVSRGNVPPCLRSFLKEIGVNCREKEGRIELDMDAFAEEILLKLKRIVRFVGDKVDPLKLQQEKGRLEKQQRDGDFLTEKSRKDGQIRAVTVASAEATLKKKREQERETELKKQRERERKAARLELQQVEKTIEFDDNFQVLEDFQRLTQCSLSEQYCGFQGGPETILELIECCHWVTQGRIVLKMSSRKGGS